MSDISVWLDKLDLGEYSPLFEENKIDVEILTEISEDDLKGLDIPLGHRKHIMRAIRALSDQTDAEISVPAAPAAAAASSLPAVSGAPAHLAERALREMAALEGERKQVTILFADLKSSTEFID